MLHLMAFLFALSMGSAIAETRVVFDETEVPEYVVIQNSQGFPEVRILMPKSRKMCLCPGGNQ